jgi:rare lipoprotein A
MHAAIIIIPATLAIALGVASGALGIGTTVGVQCGMASYYDHSGRKAADGSIMDASRMTAAHRKIPFGAKVVVENLANGRGVIVTINDRGPFIAGRIIDLSKAAADAIDMTHKGVAKVRITVVGAPTEDPRKPCS